MLVCPTPPPFAHQRDTWPGGRPCPFPVAAGALGPGVKPLESHEADLVDRLAAALAPGAAELLASFSDALGKRVDERGRKRNDPGRHRYSATLVFLAKRPLANHRFAGYPRRISRAYSEHYGTRQPRVDRHSGAVSSPVVEEDLSRSTWAYRANV